MAVGKYVRAGYLDEENAKKTLVYMLQIIDEYTDACELVIEALHEGLRLKHSIYDMFYFILARRNGAVLLTSDERMRMLCIENGVSLG